MKIEICGSLDSSEVVHTLQDTILSAEEKERSMQSANYFGYEAGIFKFTVYEDDWLLENVVYETTNVINNTSFYDLRFTIFNDNLERIYVLSRKNVNYNKKTHLLYLIQVHLVNLRHSLEKNYFLLFLELFHQLYDKHPH